MRFDAVFFDSGGTLFRATRRGDVAPGTSLEEVREARGGRLARSLAALGHNVDVERLAALLAKFEETGPGRVGPPYTYINLTNDVAAALGLRLSDDEALTCADAYVGPRYQSWLFPGTEETLRALTEAGLHVGLISNTYIPRRVADRVLRQVGLLRYLKTRIYSGHEGVVKPDPRIFRLAEERTGFTGERILYVGDKVAKDIEPPRALGWAAALKRSSAATSNGLADFEFDETPELLPFVLGDHDANR